MFLSHSSRNSRQAVAVKKWLVEQEPGLVDEIYLDVDPHTGIRPGERWKEALNKASARCEAVICLLSKQWLNSRECEVEFRYVENLHKAILCARLEPVPDLCLSFSCVAQQVSLSTRMRALSTNPWSRWAIARLRTLVPAKSVPREGTQCGILYSPVSRWAARSSSR